MARLQPFRRRPALHRRSAISAGDVTRNVHIQRPPEQSIGRHPDHGARRERYASPHSCLMIHRLQSVSCFNLLYRDVGKLFHSLCDLLF
jgi:hypothetical protein